MSVCKQSNVKYGFMTANQLMQKRENVFYISTGSSQVDELLRLDNVKKALYDEMLRSSRTTHFFCDGFFMR